MARDVWVFGDSHWRVFFPFVNHGGPLVHHDPDLDANFHDTTGNGLSGATMYSLLRDDSRHGARRHILKTCAEAGGVESAALVFGEVDARFHHDRYFVKGDLSVGRVYDLLARYKRFIDEDLLASGLVKKSVYVYHGFRYPNGTDTRHNVGAGVLTEDQFVKSDMVNRIVERILPEFLCSGKFADDIIPILPGDRVLKHMSDDGIHLDPTTFYHEEMKPCLV